ncbi:MAG TPA: hypothetical protein VFW01_03730 [bacterium]|nr:hypothetical protein [bacterium]
MRRQILVSLLGLAFLTSSGLLLVASTRGQPVSDFVSPKDTVQRYFDSILRPALGERKSPPDDIVRVFYNAGLSDRTREQVSENQFTEYWKYVADRTARALLAIVDLKYSIGEPVESEARDQALILVTGSYQGLFDAPAIVGCISDMHRSSSDCTRRSRIDSGGEFEATYWIVREDNAWKLVLHDDLVREMQNLTRPVRRYRPNVAAAQEGLIIRVQEVTLQTEATTLRLLIENTNDVEAGFRNALSLASLTDDRGVTFNTRILRSTIPETVPAHSSAVADLTFVGNLTIFEAVPVDARKLSLSLPYVRVRDSELTLALDIALRPFPHAAVIRTSIPGEPVLVYLLTLFRPRDPTGETLKTLYQTLLSSETRGQVTEQEFVEYHQSAALDAVLCRLGVPDDFTIGVPTYPAPRQASIQVTTARRGRLPARIKPVTTVLTFRVVKQEDAWKIVLEQDFVKEIKARPSPERRYHPDAKGSEGGIDVRVNEVELDPHTTRVSLFIQNFNNRDISLANVDAATKLSVKGGGTYSLYRSWDVFRLSWGLPSVVQRSLAVYATLEFGSIPLEARELWLTLGNFDTSKFSVGVKIVLDTASACP